MHDDRFMTAVRVHRRVRVRRGGGWERRLRLVAAEGGGGVVRAAAEEEPPRLRLARGRRRRRRRRRRGGSGDVNIPAAAAAAAAAVEHPDPERPLERVVPFRVDVPAPDPVLLRESVRYDLVVKRPLDVEVERLNRHLDRVPHRRLRRRRRAPRVHLHERLLERRRDAAHERVHAVAALLDRAVRVPPREDVFPAARVDADVFALFSSSELLRRLGRGSLRERGVHLRGGRPRGFRLRRRDVQIHLLDHEFRQPARVRVALARERQIDDGRVEKRATARAEAPSKDVDGD
eukprot:31109-Pelagococcus_subviridis.AAC.7